MSDELTELRQQLAEAQAQVVTMRAALEDIIFTCETDWDSTQCRACYGCWREGAEPEHAEWCPVQMAREALGGDHADR